MTAAFDRPRQRAVRRLLLPPLVPRRPRRPMILMSAAGRQAETGPAGPIIVIESESESEEAIGHVSVTTTVMAPMATVEQCHASADARVVTIPREMEEQERGERDWESRTNVLAVVRDDESKRSLMFFFYYA